MASGLRRLSLLICLVLSAAAAAATGNAGAPATGAGPEATAPSAAGTPSPTATPAAGTASGAAPSILAPPARPKRPLIRPARDPSVPPLRATGSEVPDAPYALPDAPVTACPELRPTACNFDYKPVCATLDTGVRCIAAPCPSTERKTFSSACKACREPAAASFVDGRCPPP